MNDRPKKRRPTGPSSEGKIRSSKSEPDSRSGGNRGPERAATQRHGSVGAGELPYYGRSCCRALFDRRREQIVRVYLDRELRGEFSELLSYCASKRIAYHLVGPDDLDRFTKSVHHEGICILAPKLPVHDGIELVTALSRTEPLRLLFLDGVDNPHNLGALLRTAAHFGAKAVICKSDQPFALSGSACRIAEGGAELVPVGHCLSAELFFAAVEAHGIVSVMTSSHDSVSLYSVELPARTLFVLGSEGQGISPEVHCHGAYNLAIPGSGAIESLNVGVAGAILLSEHWRRYSQ